MLNVVLTDDDGYYPIGVFPAHAGKFQGGPLRIVSVDADGYDGAGKGAGGVFVAGPITAHSLTSAGSDGIVSGAMPAVQTDRNGYSLWSGRFIGNPMPVHLA